MTSFNDVFGSQNNYLEEVIILPVGSHEGTGFNLPSGYTWDDFEYIEGSIRTTNDAQSYSGSQLTKEEIAANPTSFSMRMSYTQGASVTAMSVDATSATTFDVTQRGNNSNQRLKYLKGYKKRYSSRNASAIINVNGGNNVAVKQRYEIDIATELGQDYVGRELLVQAEVYVTSGTNDGWGVSSLSRIYLQTANSDYYSGVEAQVMGDKIIVMTAGYGTGTRAGGESRIVDGGFTNVWDTQAHVNSAPCRVKVWKIDQYLTKTYKNGSQQMPQFDIFTTTPVTLASGEAGLVDVGRTGTNGTAIVNLPSDPTIGDYTAVGDYNGSCSVLNPIVLRSGQNIHGQSNDLVLTTPNITVWLSYINATEGWRVVDGIGEDAGSVTPYEEVVILPYVVRNAASGTITLPAGYTWSDFEQIEWTIGLNANITSYGADIIQKEKVAANPTGWLSNVGFQSYTSGNRYSCAITANSATTATWLGNSSAGSHTAYPIMMKGYTKYKPVLNRGVTTLWSGSIGNNNDTVTLSEPASNFDVLYIDSAVGGIRMSNPVFAWSGAMLAGQISGTQADRVAWLTANSTTTATLHLGGSWLPAADKVTAIYGIKY